MDQTECTDFCAYPLCLSLGLKNLRCTRCKTTLYCSRFHQLGDARRHKSECKAASTSQPPRTSSRMLAVMLFPHDEDAPRIVQTECHITRPPGGAEDHHVDFASLLHTGGNTSLPVGPLEQPNPSAGPGAPQTRLYLAFDDCFAINDAPPNRAARTLTRGRAHTPWAGALLGYRAREPAAAVTQFEDVSMADLPAFAAFLTEHGAPAPPSSGPLPATAPGLHSTGVEELLEHLWTMREARVSVSDDAEPGLDWGSFDDGALPAGARTWLPFEHDGLRVERERGLERRLVLALRSAVAEEFVRLRADLGKIIAEEVVRALLTILVSAVAAYGFWRLVVLPIFSLPGMVVGWIFAVLRVIMRLCWWALNIL